MKKTLSIILAVVMLLSCMCITAFAAEADTIIWDEEELSDNTLTWTGEPSETVTLTSNVIEINDMSQIVFTMAEENNFLTSFTLNVDYNNTYDPTKKATHINETLGFEIEPITENAPSFDSFTVDVVDGEGTALVEFPAINAVGEYWYKIHQTSPIGGPNAGVVYNRETYYLHLIADYKDGGYGIVSALLHTTAPADDGTFEKNDKIDTITNLYAEGSLTVTQYAYVNSERSSADKFTNVVTFKLPEGTNIAGNITYGDKTITPDEWQDGTVSVAIDLRDGDSVIFEGLPDGTTYTVKQQSDAPAMGYDDPIYRRCLDLDDPDEPGDEVYRDRVEGTVSDLSDFVEIVNAKRIAVDVGVFLDNGAFVVLAVGALAVGAWLVISKRKENDYSDAE